MPAGAPSLTREQLAELRRWADRVVASGADGDLETFARAIVPLADEAEQLRDDPSAGGPPAPPGLDQVRARAEATVQNGASEEVRAAARAVLMLYEDIDGRKTPVRPERPRPKPVLRRRIIAVGAVAAAVILAVFFFFGGGSGDLDATGPTASLLGADDVKRLSFSVPGGRDDLSSTAWTLDASAVTGGVRARGDRIVYRPGRLADGEHTVEVSRGGGMGARSASWTFTVDTKAPVIRVTKGTRDAARGAPYAVVGAVEPGTSLRVDGRKAVVDASGRFSMPFAHVPRRAVILLAQDAAGNTTDSRLVVGTAPRLPANPVRAVHVSADAWADDGLREGVLGLLAQHRINAVELDLKDELGEIGWETGVPLAQRISAEQGLFDLRSAVALLHARGARVIGRIVAFRDPILAQWAWTHGKKQLVIQAPNGTAYSGYGGFTNFSSPVVRKYNVDIATAAARAGVDDILYDYVRRPDGPMSTMVVPGLAGNPSTAITGFLARARSALAKHGTFLGASVFGIAATRPDEIAQDVPSIAREVDYVAPMVYPSHWGPDEYGVANPNAQPFAIVRRSLADFRRAVRGTGARLVPWLQDFSLGVDYGPKEVKAQIDAADADGIDEFLLWDPRVTYTKRALDTSAALPTMGLRKTVTGGVGLAALRPSVSPDAPVADGLQPNELGGVPVIMYHRLSAEGSEYDLTPDQFRAELQRLLRGHYRPITASAYVRGDFDVPRGTTPVVLTFDDSTTSQAALLPNGSIDPSSAVGIMIDFARAHPEFRPAGTLYVNRDPFGGDPRAAQLARVLAAHGFELANHTYSHARLDELDDAGVQREIVRGSRVIHDLLPGAPIDTIALPFGLEPKDAGLALEGSWDGDRYRFRAAFLAGAEPAPSPFSSSFDPGAIPRIRSDPGTLLNGSSDWLRRLQTDPDARYVSDGDPKRITYPVALAGQLNEKYRARGYAR